MANATEAIFNAGYQFHGAATNFLYSSDINPDGSLSFNSLLFEGNSTLAAYMRAWFVSFVVHLGPNGYSAYGPAAAPAWPRYGRDSKDTLIVPKQDIAITGDPDDSAQCEFFQMGRGNDQGIWPQW